MEIKAKLEKPYTDEERCNFIVEYNHNLGYEIQETELALEAWGYTEQEQQEQEQERIKMLSCTKRDFALLLEELGISYKNTLKPLIESNERASLEWDLCERLYRFNPLLDTMAISMGITSQQLDMLFKVANGENTVDDLKATVSS